MEENTLDNNTGFTDEESRRLEETYNYRKKILEQAFSNNNVPKEPRDIEVINGVLNSIDSAIQTAAKLRDTTAKTKLKQQDIQNRELELNTIAEILKNINNTANSNNTNRTLELPNNLPLDLVPGEADLEKTEIKLEEILQVDKE